MQLIDTERGTSLDGAIAITTSKTSRAANTQIFWARDHGGIHGGIRAAARRAIRDEIESRGGLSTGLRTEVRNVYQAPSTMVHYSAEFAEVAS